MVDEVSNKSCKSPVVGRILEDRNTNISMFKTSCTQGFQQDVFPLYFLLKNILDTHLSLGYKIHKCLSLC